MPRQEFDFSNFIGGLNTVSANDQLSESEFPFLKNIELGDRGSLKRRSGMIKHYQPEVEGVGQGFFRLYRPSRIPLEVFAIKGSLYQRPEDEITLNEKIDYEFEKAETFKDNLDNNVPCKIIKVKLGNARSFSEMKIFEVGEKQFEQVNAITGKNQILINTDSFLLISLADSDTNFGSEPKNDDIKKYFRNKIVRVVYPVTNTKIEIIGLPDGFQTDRPIEGVQYKERMFFATGTKLVEFNGIIARTVEPHKPDSLEALYVGTNALADDPLNYMQDGIAPEVQIDGVTSSLRIGIVNKPTTLRIYVSKKIDSPVIEYKYKYRKVGATDWKQLRDFTDERECIFTPTELGDYEFDCYAREKGITDEEKYARFIVPRYTVEESDKNEKVDFRAIHLCNRIILHWERLYLYGDDLDTSMIFVSHLQQPNFFPVSNTLQFDNKQIEALTALVHYRDMLVAFTPTSIQALYGKAPAEFTRISLNSSIGCVAPYSAHVTGNYITFLSKDGIYALDSIGYAEEKANVTKVDKKVTNVIFKDKTACAVVNNSQYQLYYPERNRRMRMYYEQSGAWTMDESEKMDFIVVHEWDNIVYGQSKATGIVMKFDETVYNDDGFIYEDRIETKEIDFGQPYAKKKIKQVKFLLSAFDKPVNLSISVYADTSLIVNPETSHAYVDEHGEVKWKEQLDTNIHIRSGAVFGQWVMGRDSLGKKDSEVRFIRVSGRCRRTRIVISHTEDTPNSLLGFGYALVSAAKQTQGVGASSGDSSSGGDSGSGGSSGSAFN